MKLQKSPAKLYGNRKRSRRSNLFWRYGKSILLVWVCVITLMANVKF